MENRATKIFLDSGDPEETKQAIELLGFLDGQTTNPTLISKNPQVAEKLSRGEKMAESEALDFYKKTVREVSGLIPHGSVSIEVYADKNTASETMMEQGKEMFGWINNAHVKFPTTKEGIKAAKIAIEQGMRVNMTLCFSQEQSAAVFVALKNAKEGQVFISPFIGRLDDRGENGMDLIANILKMKKESGSKIEVLTASVRGLNHFLRALQLRSDIITSPFKILKEWAERGKPMPDDSFKYQPEGLKPIAYQEFDLSQNWEVFDISHPLTDAGMEKFSTDWYSIINTDKHKAQK